MAVASEGAPAAAPPGSASPPAGLYARLCAKHAPDATTTRIVIAAATSKLFQLAYEALHEAATCPPPIGACAETPATWRVVGRPAHVQRHLAAACDAAPCLVVVAVDAAAEPRAAAADWLDAVDARRAAGAGACVVAFGDGDAGCGPLGRLCLDRGVGLAVLRRSGGGGTAARSAWRSAARGGAGAPESVRDGGEHFFAPGDAAAAAVGADDARDGTGGGRAAAAAPRADGALPGEGAWLASLEALSGGDAPAAAAAPSTPAARAARDAAATPVASDSKNVRSFFEGLLQGKMTPS